MKSVKIVLTLVLAVVVGGLVIDNYAKEETYAKTTNQPITEVNPTQEETTTPSTVAAADTHTDEVEVATEPTVVEEEQPKVTVAFERTVLYETTGFFEAPLYWAMSNDNTLAEYKTMESLINDYYTTFASEELSRNFVTSFFYEDGNGVQLHPKMGIPTLFDMNKEYTVSQTEDDKLQVKQETFVADGVASYILIDYIFDYEVQLWKINDITYA